LNILIYIYIYIYIYIPDSLDNILYYFYYYYGIIIIIIYCRKKKDKKRSYGRHGRLPPKVFVEKSKIKKVWGGASRASHSLPQPPVEV
jgi:hypothetical protein